MWLSFGSALWNIYVCIWKQPPTWYFEELYETFSFMGEGFTCLKLGRLLHGQINIKTFAACSKCKHKQRRFQIQPTYYRPQTMYGFIITHTKHEHPCTDDDGLDMRNYRQHSFSLFPFAWSKGIRQHCTTKLEWGSSCLRSQKDFCRKPQYYV